MTSADRARPSGGALLPPAHRTLVDGDLAPICIDVVCAFSIPAARIVAGIDELLGCNVYKVSERGGTSE